MDSEYFNFLRNLVITLTLSFIPSLLLLRFLYKRDENPEPHGILLRTFFLGFAGAIPVLIITFPLAPFFYKFQNPMLAAIYWSVFCAAIPEEIIKFLIILKYSSKKSAFDEPMDGIVYGVTASLGFATIESIMHIAKTGYAIALTRAIMAVPAHACFGAVMGYFIGMAHFHKKGKNCYLVWASYRYFPAKEKEKVQTSNDTFFNSAGIWETREITLKSLREKAWKRN